MRRVQFSIAACGSRIHQEQVPKSRAFREDFTLVKMVPTWLRYHDARPESFSIVENPLV